MDPLNKGLMTFASYNAGPGRVRQLRREAVQRNLDPNVWFGNVERVASERIGRESPVSTLPVWTHAHRAISRRPTYFCRICKVDFAVDLERSVQVGLASAGPCVVVDYPRISIT